MGTALIELLTNTFSMRDEVPLLTAWFDAGEDYDGFAEFLEGTDLFEVREEDLNGEPVRVAVWNGRTIVELEEEAAEEA